MEIVEALANCRRISRKDRQATVEAETKRTEKSRETTTKQRLDNDRKETKRFDKIEERWRKKVLEYEEGNKLADIQLAGKQNHKIPINGIQTIG